MSQQSRTTLKSYFQTGSIPAQTDFVNLIDSFINETDDQVFVDSNQNVGVGFAMPPARLAVKNAGGTILPASFTLTAGSAQAQVLMQQSGQQLSTLIYPGDVIQVSGVGQLFSIVSVASNSSVQLNPSPNTSVSAAQVTVLKNLLYIGDATPQLVLTNQGNMGIGITLPSEILDVNGNVRATGFIGDGSKLANLAAANLAGQIPAAALPAISFSAIQGQLSLSQLPTGYDPGTNGIGSFTASASDIANGGTATLSWTVTGADYVVLSYLNNYQVTTISSQTGTIALSPGTYQVSPDITQIFTLSAYKAGSMFDQSQLTITVVPPVQPFMQQCHSSDVPAVVAVSNAGNAFGLGILCASNVTLLAMAMNGVYLNSDIYKAIPAYYLSLHYTWNANTNGSWITAVLYP